MSATDTLPINLPPLHPELEIVTFDESIVVFNDRSNRAHELRYLSAVILDACREGLSTQTLITELVDAGAGDRQYVAQVITETLASFDEYGLIVGSIPPPPCIGCAKAAATAAAAQRRWWQR